MLGRRDQLWTNDGQFKFATPGMEYPEDLAVSAFPSVALPPSPLPLAPLLCHRRPRACDRR